MSNTNTPDATAAHEAEAVIDRLLGVEAREPGKACKLPAVIRVIEKLEPAGGFAVPVFPASYLGDGDHAIYDLSGIEYGETAETIRSKDRDRVIRPILRARLCALDSAQSQANRMEPAFVDDGELRRLVPQAQATVPRSDGNNGSENILRLPHRIADFRVRLSQRGNKVREAIANFSQGNALPILRMMPTSVLFGFWDSRGDQTKHARVLLARIDAFDVVPCTRHATYNGPYSDDEFAKVVLQRPLTKGDPKPSEGGFTNALDDGLGGVIAHGGIERLALLSLTDLARVSCVSGDEVRTKELTNAARRYLFALAALAEGYARATGSHRLRSGCELVHTGDSSVTVDLRGSTSEYKDADALKDLFRDRPLLVAIAAGAKATLEIPDTLEDFTVTRESLLNDFGVAVTSDAVPSTAAASPNPTATGDQLQVPTKRRRRQQ